MNIDEIEITVPWGHLAAKVWGNRSDPLVLVFHGVLDNAGSFDRLIPLLPTSFCYIAFDLPSHGKSSPWPQFFPAYTINNIIVYKLIADHFKRDKYIILGHSYGGQIGFLFAQLYPELVEKLIMLDTIHLFPVHVSQFKQSLRDRFEAAINVHKKIQSNKRPTYTYEDALEKLTVSRQSYLSREGAEALLQRAVEHVGDGKYVFRSDPRMKSFINPIQDFDYIIATIKKIPVTCPVMIVLARGSEMHEVYMKPIIKVLKRYKNIRIIHVDGDHDVHNSDPEIVAPYVSNFLLKQIAKL